MRQNFEPTLANFYDNGKVFIAVKYLKNQAICSHCYLNDQLGVQRFEAQHVK